MIKINKIIKTGLYLFFAVSILQCKMNTFSECKSIKIQLLLEDLFKKKSYFTILGNPPPPVDYPFEYFEPDSSMYFNYLYSSNLRIPDKEFYLHWDKRLEPSYPDSVRLKVIKDLNMKNKCSNILSVKLLEVNEDTTKMKISLSYGSSNNIALSSGIFTYLFDEKNCKWIVIDSSRAVY